MERKRNCLLDIVKGVTIILMVFGHSMQCGTGDYFVNKNIWDDILFKLIYSFHMPVFAGISGYLFFFSVCSKGVLQATISRYKRMFPVIVSWIPIMLIVGYAWGMNKLKITSAIWLFFTDYWFLWTIVISSTLICITYITNNKNISLLTMLAIQISLLVIPDFSWSAAHKFMFVCYFIGYLIAKNDLIKKIKMKKMVAGGAMIAWLILLLFWSSDSYIYTTGYTIFGSTAKFVWYKKLGIDIYRIIVAVAGSTAIIGILNKIYQMRGKECFKTIEWCGKHSLAIYVITGFLHNYVIEPVFKGLHVENYLMMVCISIILTMVLLLLCFCLITVINRNKKISRFLIGE
ncbi:MAG: acyltransferase family protein [Bacteroidales bacterium]|nr:acyltransferase family protein [Clostridium sp.]MCM1203296.1 acyltransferase family protein [Bacteroidales bacterium]